MENLLIEEIRKIDSDCIIEKTIDERIEEMTKLVKMTIGQSD